MYRDAWLLTVRLRHNYIGTGRDFKREESLGERFPFLVPGKIILSRFIQ